MERAKDVLLSLKRKSRKPRKRNNVRATGNMIVRRARIARNP